MNYYKYHKAEMLAQQKKYRAKDKERWKEYRRLYREQHKSSLKEKAALWYSRNKQHVHDHYLANYERHLKQNAEWAKKHPEVGKAKAARRRARKGRTGGSFSAIEWISLCKCYGNKCLCCRKKKKPLEADHVIPVSKKGSSNISNIQPLCRSCNAKKGTKITDYRKGDAHPSP